MGKKSSTLLFLKALYYKNDSFKKKPNQMNANEKKKNKRRRHKKKKNKQNDDNSNLMLQMQDNISNTDDYFLNNINTNNNINNNLPIFNNIIDSTKEAKKPQWMNSDTKNIKNINFRFDREIIEYVNYIIPKNLSLSQRQKTKQLLTDIIKKYKPDWEVVLFGSFSQNTSTVFSDLDFVILSKENSSKKNDYQDLMFILRKLRNESFSQNIVLIKARVPILKGTCSLTGIHFDISINRDNGYKAAKIIRKIFRKYKILKPIIIILKILLKINQLNVASSGGMSSFLLFHLVYFFYIIYMKRIQYGFYKKDFGNDGQDYSNNNNFNVDFNGEREISDDSYYDLKSYDKNPNNHLNEILSKGGGSSTDETSNEESSLLKNEFTSNNSEEKQRWIKYNELFYDKENESEDNLFHNDKLEDIKIYKNISHFLFAFLKFYAKFDYHNLGFSLNDYNFGTTFFKKERKDMICGENICVESIQDKGVDIGRICYNYPKIVSLFENCYKKIKLEKQKNTCSILQALNFPTI